jgi:arabinogalactan endo-1,4-beta-galactosidase
MKLNNALAGIVFMMCSVHMSCDDESQSPEPPANNFYMGVDLSYVNQILDHGGIYKNGESTQTPYQIFSAYGANVVRLRLWHNPQWTKEVYGGAGTQLYNDITDVEKAIQLSKAQQMKVLLDFHYSDRWADPGHQEVPAAWKNIQSLQVLGDSVYNYTFKTLSSLKIKGLMPDLVQIGNETNCGFLFQNVSAGFPALNACNGNWSNVGSIYNRAIWAVRDVDAGTKIIIHVADPVNVQWFFDHLTSEGNVNDFDIIGVSYYPLWHKGVTVDDLSLSISGFRTRFSKDVIMVETAYPWTHEANDSYTNLFGSETPITGYPYTVEGHRSMMRKLTQEVYDGGGIGLVYWEPAWITSQMKDLWGTGSSWENNALFDFDGKVLGSIDYLNFEYEK